MESSYQRLKTILLSVILVLVSVDVYASNKSNAASWQLISNGTATWMWLDIYDAELYAETRTLPENYLDDSVPLKLKLCYLKSITPDIFVEGANKALPKNLTTQLQTEVTRLHDAYQAVQSGDCYALVYHPETGTQLQFNQKVVFETMQPKFKSVYFGVWLGDNPLSEDLKQSLVN